jgi:hypothetical protein
VGKGSAILEQPLNAVLWLIKDLKASGIELKKGDLPGFGSRSRRPPPEVLGWLIAAPGRADDNRPTPVGSLQESARACTAIQYLSAS